MGKKKGGHGHTHTHTHTKACVAQWIVYLPTIGEQACVKIKANSLQVFLHHVALQPPEIDATMPLTFWKDQCHAFSILLCFTRISCHMRTDCIFKLARISRTPSPWNAACPRISKYRTPSHILDHPAITENLPEGEKHKVAWNRIREQVMNCSICSQRVP